MKEDCEEDGFKKINLLTEDQIENLTLQCEVIEIDESVICKRHTDKYIRYSLHEKSCCDPFTQHKKRITSVAVFLIQNCLMDCFKFVFQFEKRDVHTYKFRSVIGQ